MNDSRPSPPQPEPVPVTPVQGVLGYLIASPLGFAAIGYGLDTVLGTERLTALGAMMGLVLALYAIHLRYGGAVDDRPAPQAERETAQVGSAASRREPAPVRRTTNEETT
ncbi:MAG: AtpZ/AtpI family protein [Mobilicoccus sp.]|nr:AtpZ/AtpI family protein [Mobilicoccus sp.]